MADRTGTFYAAETLAKYGINAELLVGDGASPENFEAIAGIRVITPGEKSTSDILTTHLRSPDRHAEHAPGRRDSGPIQFTAIWMPSEESQSNAGGGSGVFTDGGLFRLERTQERRNFLIRLYGSDAEESSPEDVFDWGPFRAYVASLTPGQIVDNDVVLLNGSLQPTRDYNASLP